MKWIGQHIWDFISRFRNDVYLENIADGTVANDKFLGLDSNNKIVKETATTTVSGFLVDDDDDTTTGILTANGGFNVGSTEVRDDYILFTPSTNDTVRITAEDDGVLTMRTTDNAGVDSHMNFNADGDIFFEQKGEKFQATPPICYSTRAIKVFAHEFVGNNDGGAAVIYDDTSGNVSMSVTNTANDLSAIVKIPALFQVTHIQFHTATTLTNKCLARAINYTTGAVGTTTAGATPNAWVFDSNTNYQLIRDTDGAGYPLVGSATQDLFIGVAIGSDKLYGATITIENF